MPKITVNAWPHTWLQQNGFPEDALNSFKSNSTTKSIGLAFSGGGTRSGACTLGQLKAFEQLNLLPKIKCISAVIGGGWAATPFVFVEKTILSKYWGRIQEPEEIELDTYTTVLNHSFQKCLTNAINHISNTSIRNS